MANFSVSSARLGSLSCPIPPVNYAPPLQILKLDGSSGKHRTSDLSRMKRALSPTELHCRKTYGLTSTYRSNGHSIQDSWTILKPKKVAGEAGTEPTSLVLETNSFPVSLLPHNVHFSCQRIRNPSTGLGSGVNQTLELILSRSRPHIRTYPTH